MSSEDQSDIPVTEQENPRTRALSELPAAEIVRLMNEEDARVAGAVRLVLPDVAREVQRYVAGTLRAMLDVEVESVDVTVEELER